MLFLVIFLFVILFLLELFLEKYLYEYAATTRGSQLGIDLDHFDDRNLYFILARTLGLCGMRPLEGPTLLDMVAPYDFILLVTMNGIPGIGISFVLARENGTMGDDGYIYAMRDLLGDIPRDIPIDLGDLGNVAIVELGLHYNGRAYLPIRGGGTLAGTALCAYRERIGIGILGSYIDLRNECIFVCKNDFAIVRARAWDLGGAERLGARINDALSDILSCGNGILAILGLWVFATCTGVGDLRLYRDIYGGERTREEKTIGNIYAKCAVVDGRKLLGVYGLCFILRYDPDYGTLGFSEYARYDFATYGLVFVNFIDCLMGVAFGTIMFGSYVINFTL